jgi:putative hemolysin
MRLLAPAALLVLLAFFAAAEFSLIRLRPTRVQLLAADGCAGAAAGSTWPPSWA